MTTPDDEKRDEEQEDEYVKADTRASRAEAEQEPAETPEEPDEAAAEEQAPPEESEGDRPDINVYSLLRMSIGMYTEQAWIHMGVRMDPNKQTTETNLRLAQVAIDTVAFIAEKLQPDLDDVEKREIEQVLANLRINFVQRA